VEDVSADAVLLAHALGAAPGRDAVFEAPIGLGERTDEVLGPGPNHVLACMPGAQRLVQGCVAAVLGLEDLLLDAHVPGDAVAELKQFPSGDETRYAAVAIGYRVNRGSQMT
jgi:hypothetical protein